jgi:hypothetical protein
MADKEALTVNEKIRLGLACIITVAWLISFYLSITTPDTWSPPGELNPLMLLVAGTIFGEGLVRSAIKSIIQQTQNSNNEGTKE